MTVVPWNCADCSHVSSAPTDDQVFWQVVAHFAAVHGIDVESQAREELGLDR